MCIILREVVRHSRDARMHLAPSQSLFVHYLASCGLDEWWSRQEDPPLILRE